VHHQAIQTKFLAAKNHQGVRVRASASEDSITLAWNDGVGTEKNHKAAAHALAAKLGWEGEWSGGWFDDCYVYVLTSDVAFTVERVKEPA
jgi:hypothetical protein